MHILFIWLPCPSWGSWWWTVTEFFILSLFMLSNSGCVPADFSSTEFKVMPRNNRWGTSGCHKQKAPANYKTCMPTKRHNGHWGTTDWHCFVLCCNTIFVITPTQTGLWSQEWHRQTKAKKKNGAASFSSFEVPCSGRDWRTEETQTHGNLDPFCQIAQVGLLELSDLEHTGQLKQPIHQCYLRILLLQLFPI